MKAIIKLNRTLSTTIFVLASFILAPVALKATDAHDTSKVQTAANAPATAFDNIKPIRVGLLDVGYAEVGPRNGQPVIHPPAWLALRYTQLRSNSSIAG